MEEATVLGRAYHKSDIQSRVEAVQRILERLAVVLADPSHSGKSPKDQVEKAEQGFGEIVCTYTEQSVSRLCIAYCALKFVLNVVLAKGT